MRAAEIGKRILIEQRVANEVKSPFVAYVVWAVLGWGGGHRYYFGKNISGFILLILTMAALLTTPFGYGVLFVIPMITWYVVDALLIVKWIGADKLKIRAKIEAEVEAETA